MDEQPQHVRSEPRAQLTEAEAKAREAEQAAAGIEVITDAPSTVTLLQTMPEDENARDAEVGQ